MAQSRQDHQETLAANKDAIYDLNLGPSEISMSRGTITSFLVSFDAPDGKPREAVIPVPSPYRTICETLNAVRIQKP